MKKQLLLGSALLAAISAFPQAGRRPASCNTTATKIASKFATDYRESTLALKQSIGPVENPNNVAQEQASATMPPSTINWKLIGGMSNIYGALVSTTRPLQYNAQLNAVTFVHRKSLAYQATPSIATGTSGIIVAEVSTNWGTTFDSTCLYQDATNWGRFPGAAIYNPVGNTNIANAYIVGVGPTVGSSGFTGNWYASKKLNAFTNSPDAGPNAMQAILSNAASYNAGMGPLGFNRLGFSSTDDGKVRSMGYIANDAIALTGLRGYGITKGSFNAGSFSWTLDSIIPNLVVDGVGDKQLGNGQMAWNQSGTVGYVVILGPAATAINSNRGFQPNVYKTTNSGTSWAQIPGIDFNSPAMAPLLKSVNGVSTNSNLAIPSFNDFDITVDANNDLHIAAVYKSTYSSHNDSLGYTQGFTVSVNPGSDYAWLHGPGSRPYLYDFIGNGSAAWQAILVDSLGSQEASSTSGQAGYNENPWDPTAANAGKTDNVDSRIQLGHTPDGQYITISFSESDTNATTGGLKYNNKPNLKARCLSVATKSVSPTEINVTKVALGQGTSNPNVTNRATLNYMSPTTGSATIVSTPSSYTADIYTPMVVTNSNPYAQLTNNTIWYQSGKLSYVFPTPLGVKENSQNSASNSVVFPNPASNNAVLAIDLKDNSSVEITVLNTIGQLVKSNKAQGQVGQNNINIDLTGLSTGIYMVNVKVGNATSTKKLIVQ